MFARLAARPQRDPGAVVQLTPVVASAHVARVQEQQARAALNLAAPAAAFKSTTSAMNVPAVLGRFRMLQPIFIAVAVSNSVSKQFS